HMFDIKPRVYRNIVWQTDVYNRSHVISPCPELFVRRKLTGRKTQWRERGWPNIRCKGGIFLARSAPSISQRPLQASRNSTRQFLGGRFPRHIVDPLGVLYSVPHSLHTAFSLKTSSALPGLHSDHS